MKTLLGMRKALLVAPLLAVAAAGAFALNTTPDAPGAAETVMLASNCTYYNNAAHTQIVGQFGYDCCNNRVAWGVKTQHSVCGGCFICFPPPR
jgi:hypothetical protein